MILLYAMKVNVCFVADFTFDEQNRFACIDFVYKLQYNTIHKKLNCAPTINCPPPNTVVHELKAQSKK
jgi:hypothetical protein